MITKDLPDTSAGSVPHVLQSLASLSRNASAISTSSSDSSPSEHIIAPRPRPIRTFTGPRSRSPHSVSPRAPKPPHYLAKEFGRSEDVEQHRKNEADAKARSKSRGRNTALDFKFGHTLGDGSYSTVKLATHRLTGKQYAVKMIEKMHLKRHDKQAIAHAERNALMTLGSGHPGIVRLWYTFQDEIYLYFVLDLARNGEMKTLLSRMGSLSVDCARYYSALLVDILKYMHSKKVIHRDLKPENLLLDDDFRLKITDFGTGKVLANESDKSKTWVGTAQYIAPELLLSKETSKATDYWALGCVIYQMITGRFAFSGLSEYLTFEKIKKLEYSFPDGFNEKAKDLVQRLLVANPSDRLGAGTSDSGNDISALCTHPFFEDIKWDTLWTDPVPPLSAGLLKVEHPLKGHDRNWEDILSTWDEFSTETEDEDFEWASDAHRGIQSVQEQYTPYSPAANDANTGDLHSSSRRDTGSTIHGTERPFKPQRSQQTLSESPFSASPSSSSTEETRLPSKMESLSLDSRDNDKQSQASPINDHGRPDVDTERGRKQILTPVQGNWPQSYTDIATLIKLPSDELVLFNTIVNERKSRRRASRLFPLPVPPIKAKTRQLVLTSKRLLCLKQRKGGDISIKSELSFRAPDKLKEKDNERASKAIIVSVERKGDREFVVLTSTMNHSYCAQDSSQANQWCDKLNEIIGSQSS